MELRLRTHIEQVADYLRGEIHRGRWTDELPGADRLGADLGVNHTTVGAALKLLEADGLLLFRGAGRRREIIFPKNQPAPQMRLAFLDYDPASKNEAATLNLLNRLADRGHVSFFAEKTLTEMQMNLSRISRMVGKTRADAWIVASAPRRVLEWFLKNDIKTMAMFGAFGTLPIASASPNHKAVLLKITNQLLDLGHRRIVFLANGGRRQAKLGALWVSLFKTMEERGVPTGFYNLPEWENSPEGFRRLLESLFQMTPPTALLIEENPHLIAALKFLGERQIQIPRDLSLVCMDGNAALDFCVPAVTQIRWKSELVLRRVLRWADNMARGKEDLRQYLVDAELLEGGTVAPPS